MRSLLVFVIVVIVVSRLLQRMQLTGSRSKITAPFRTAVERRRAAGPPAVITARQPPQIQGRPFPWRPPPAPQPPASSPPPAHPTARQPPADPLSSSLNSSLSSSLSDSEPAIPEDAILSGPQLVPLTPDLQRRVMELMDQRFEVGAVRLVCDETNVGILDAQKTVRTLAGLPTL